MRYRVFAFVIAASLVVTRSAYAQERGLAVLVGASEGDPIVLKISDELRALGFDVEVAPHGTDRERIRKRARRDDAVAVVLVNEREIEVLVVTPEQVHDRRFPRRESDQSTSALAAVEVVRGYLVPVQEPTNVTSNAPEPKTVRPTKAPSFSVRLSSGFVSAGSFPTQGSVTLGGARHFGRFAIDLGTVMTIPSADAWSAGVDVGFKLAPLGFTRPVSFAVGIGTMGLVVSYKEDGKKYTSEVTAVPHVAIAIRVVIRDSVSARVDGMFGAPVPSPAFKSKTGSDIQFGSTIVAASAGLEVAW